MFSVCSRLHLRALPNKLFNSSLFHSPDLSHGLLSLPHFSSWMATVGIRREDKSRWERRVPLSPDHVQQLVDQGIDVIIQPSSLRIFDDQAYQIAGAKIMEDLSEADLILAVKEVPSNLLVPNKTYMFFSHTIKAQQHNMPMLDDILQKKIRLIDYEKIVDGNNQRLVRFGRYAGIAGMVDMLRALGNRLLYFHHSTPFLSMGYAHMYVSLEKAKEAVQTIGEEIALKGVPQELSPMIFVFTGGEGNCSMGAQEIFNLLPHKYVTMDELPALSNSKDPGHRFRLYGCVLGSEHYMVPKDKKQKFSKQEYYSSPEKYESVFAEKVAPYATVIINNTYWDHRFPRLLTTQQVKSLWKKAKNRTRLVGVADISCDINGSIEIMNKTTTIDEPLFVYDPITSRTKDGIEGPGIFFLAVDNLPTELPREASVHFGDMLLKFIPAITNSKTDQPYEEMIESLPREVASGVITHQGELTPAFKYIDDLRKAHGKKINRILILGSGLVAPGLIASLEQDGNVFITIASYEVYNAEKLLKTKNMTAISLDVQRETEKLRDLIQSHDLVISILPQTFHPKIAEECITFKKNMLTASYISPAMANLHKQAVENGVIILNEIGLDPGIDHMSAVKIINDVQSQGGKVVGFRSVCGGLPAPEFSDNPFHYKFSWSPRGVLQACKNPAKFLKDGETVHIDAEKLMEAAQPENVYPCFQMEVIPNRDSLSYIDQYNLKDAKDVFRGTLRYAGYSNIIWGLKHIGLLSAEPVGALNPSAPTVKRWPDLIRLLNKIEKNADLKQEITKRLFHSDSDLPEQLKSANSQNRIIKAFEWLGLFDPTKEVDPARTPIDTLCKILIDALAFKEHERDMVLMQHTFDVEWNNGSREKLRSTLISFGDVNGDSAMAKTVGYPLGIAAQLILNGTIKSPGVLAPVIPEIYNPVLQQLKDVGINFVEDTE